MKRILFVLGLIALVATASSAVPWSISSYLGGGTLNYAVNNELTVGSGVSFASPGSVYGLQLSGNYKLAKAGDIQTSAGVYYITDSSGVWGVMGLTYGVEAMVVKNLSVGADLILVSSTTTGGVATTTVLPGTAVKVTYYL